MNAAGRSGGPPRFLDGLLLSEVASGFAWPAPYTIDEDLPDGVMLVFPRCSLYFAEGVDGDVELLFLAEDTGEDVTLDLVNAMMVAVPVEQRDGSPLTEGLVRDRSPWATETKVRNGVHDLCLTVLTHLTHVVLGDSSWVATYRAMTGRGPG